MRSPAVAAVVFMIVAASGCSSRGGGGASRPAVGSPFVSVDPASTSPTDQAIARAQNRLRADDRDDNARLALAEAFLQKVRENGDASLYTRAEALLDQARSGRDAEPVILVAQGTLALARHRFEEALRLGREASALAPGNVGALGVVVDALNELGRYDEALEATQAMVDARPSLSSLARVSYARELRGDLPGAVAAMAQAAAAGMASGENLAYVQVQLGNLQLTSGDVAGAEASYLAADAAFPGFPLAKAGRARVLVARGAPGAAADVLAEVMAVLPTAEHAIAHGDALAGAGRQAEADDAYDLVDAIARLYRANGVDVDLEMAVFAADHRPGKETVERARRAVDDRPSIGAHDALAWSLFTAGRIDEAGRVADRAVALGTRDPRIRYHAAAIAMARDDRRSAARHLGVVLSTNPRFSAVLTPAVAALAGRLDLAVPRQAGAPGMPALFAANP